MKRARCRVVGRTKMLLGAFCVLLLASAFGQQAPRNPNKEAMRFKLYFAQGVLDGIATENFSLIATNAQKLKRLSQAGDWQLRGTSEYQRLTSEFQRATESLERAASRRNLDAATIAYFQLTTTCVTCHRYLRGAEVGWNFDPAPAFVALKKSIAGL